MARRRTRSNPYAQPYPADWDDWTQRQKASWRRRNWIGRAGEKPRSLEQRAASRLVRGNPGKRGRYYVRDEWLGEMVELPSVRSAARFARSRLGDLGDIYVEQDEALVPLKSLRKGAPRMNPRRRRSRRA